MSTTVAVTTGGNVTVGVEYNPVGGTGTATNVGITRTSSTVVVTSSSGTDGTIAAADGSNAGIFTAANYTKLAAISGTNTGDQDLSSYLTSATASSTYQPLDADLTSIAGLSKAGNTLKVVRVNAAETAYELATVSGGGGSGDALVANTLDQFADVTQTAGQTLAITSSTTLSGGTHSGTNTGDNATNSQYSGLVTNATHTGDATGATSLTLATVNSNVGSFGSATAAPAITVNAKGLVTAASTNTITPAVGSITGLGTGVSTALAVNVGSAGAPVLLDGAGGTPSSGTLTNCTGLPTAGLVDDAVTLAKMAAGTAGNLITYDASGNPAVVSTGTSAQVLTSNGAGAAPTFQAVPGGGGGLTNITETLVTASPNATANTEVLAVTGGTTRTDLNIKPKGDGAFYLGDVADDSTGGAKRGIKAVDLQMSRDAAYKCASGAYSVAAGIGNRASGQGAVALGYSNDATANYGCALGFISSATGEASFAAGYSANASGIGSIALGRTVSASGSYSHAAGYNLSAAGDYSAAFGDATLASGTNAFVRGVSAVADRYSMFAEAAGQFAAQGDAQSIRLVMRNRTTTNAAVTLYLNGSSIRPTVPSDKIQHGILKIVGLKSDGSAVATYLRQVAIKNVAGTTSLVGSVITLGTDTSAGTSISITADDTNDALSIEPTGVTDEVWRWVATFDALEVKLGS